MFSLFKKNNTRFFTYIWLALFLNSQELAFAGRSATEIAVTEWSPLSGPIVTPVRSVDSAEGLDIKVKALSLEETAEPASTSTTSSTTSISAPSSSSASPERHLSVEGDQSTIIPDFRSFLDDLEMTAKLADHNFVLMDHVKRVIVFHRVFVGDQPSFINNGPKKRSGFAQEFSRSWIADRLEFIGRQDLLEQIIMERYNGESSSSSEDVEREESTRQYNCIRTASSIIQQVDGPAQVKFYAVYDQLKPGCQEQSEKKLRPDGFYLKEDWSQEASALVYLDYLAAHHLGNVINFSSRNLTSINWGGCLQRLERVFEFDPDALYSIDFSYSSLSDHCVRELGRLLSASPFLNRVTAVNLDHNRFKIEAHDLHPFIPLLMQDSFSRLNVTGSNVTRENFDVLVEHIKEKSSDHKEDSEIRPKVFF